MDIKSALAEIIEQRDLSQSDMTSVMRQIMTGQATDAQIGAFLIAMRLKGESIDEIVGAVTVMRELATPVKVKAEPLIDTCGTGGDGANLFNVSTASAFVVAASGAYVAKHGNRSVSSSTGSADVLEAMGVNLNAKPEITERAIENIGLGFMFAPAHHGAMMHAIGPRKEIAQRTIFNMLGPMTNPAGVKRQVIGVFDKKLCRPMAEVLQRLGSEHVLVVHADDGLDELSIAAKNYIAELKNGSVREYELNAQDFGIDENSLEGLSVSSAQESLDLIQGAFANAEDEKSQRAAAMIALNSGAALYVAGVANSIENGVKLAEDTISTGAAKEKIKELVEFTGLA